MTLLTPGTVAIRCCCDTGSVTHNETACRVTSLRGFASSLPRVNSVKIVARVIIRNNETTRLEIVSSVRRLLRRMFFKTSLLNFINASVHCNLLVFGQDASADGYATQCEKVQVVDAV